MLFGPDAHRGNLEPTDDLCSGIADLKSLVFREEDNSKANMSWISRPLSELCVVSKFINGRLVRVWSTNFNNLLCL